MWATNSKCSSQASAFACIAVTQLHLLSNLKVIDTVHLPGVLMGEIDAMSRREIHPDARVILTVGFDQHC